MNTRTGPARAFSALRSFLRYAVRGFSLIVAPHGTGTTVTVNLPAKAAVSLVVLVAAVVVGAVFVGATYTKLAIVALEAARLRTENQALRAENDKINELEQEIASIEQARRRIEAWAGVVQEGRTPASALVGEVDLVNTWPRRYTYAMMKPFYTEFASRAGSMMLPATGWISRGFLAGGSEEPAHPGIDIAAPKGTPVRAAMGGVARRVGWDEVYGNRIVIEHGDSLFTVYGHNEQILVKEGDSVAKGQVIATVGSTGRSTAPHVHFEILKQQTPVDPGAYVDLES